MVAVSVVISRKVRADRQKGHVQAGSPNCKEVQRYFISDKALFSIAQMYFCPSHIGHLWM